MKKRRYYKVEYWDKAGTKHTIEDSFGSYNDAYSWVYNQDGTPLNVTFLGWK